jgi:hypothetical protein
MVRLQTAASAREGVSGHGRGGRLLYAPKWPVSSANDRAGAGDFMRAAMAETFSTDRALTKQPMK